MLTLQEKEEFNAIVSDINKNLVIPYNKANGEVKDIELSVKSIQTSINELYEIVDSINATLDECRNIYYNVLIKR